MAEEKKKMQSVSFRHVGEMLNYLPEDQREITERLYELIRECLPEAQGKLSFNAPFFFLRKAVCYIWPGAIPWGSKTREGVDIGFSYGYLLQDESGYLQVGQRKYVRSRSFYSLEDIDEELIRQFLLESAELDELVYRERMINKRGKKNG